MPTLRTALAILFTAIAACSAAAPLSGKAIPGMESADLAYSEFMTKHGIPGGSVAIMKNGLLVYARGFGWADTDRRRPVEPTTLFRIASVSKPVTALAVAKLVEEGKLKYEQTAFPSLRYPTPTYAGAKRDPRLNRITVMHLLQHSGGWDRATAIDPTGLTGFDPMFYPNVASRDLTGKTQPPATAQQVARWMVGKPLQFDPGTRHVYSNLGYCILGRMIERATGQSYQAYTRSLLAKAGITTMRIGGSRASELLRDETRYYDTPGAKMGNSVWNEANTPNPYRHSIPTMDAHGGWIATPTDLVRFTTLLDGRPDPPDLLKARTIGLMHLRPSFAPSAAQSHNYYGLGWSFWEREDAKFRNWFHSGSLPGTMSMLIRSDNGVTWAAVFNLRPASSKAAFADLDAAMWKAVRGVTKWP